MFRINERYEKDRSIIKSDFICYTPPTLNNMNNPKNFRF